MSALQTAVARAKEGKKALTTFAVAFAGLEGFAATLDAQYGDQPWIHAVALGIATVAGAATWFVKNQQTIDQVLDAFDGDPEIAAAVTEKVAEDPALAAQVVEKAVTNPDVVERLLKQNTD